MRHLDIQEHHFRGQISDQLVRLGRAARCLDNLKMGTVLLDLTANGLASGHFIIDNKASDRLAILIHLNEFSLQMKHAKQDAEWSGLHMAIANLQLIHNDQSPSNRRPMSKTRSMSEGSALVFRSSFL
jgi:hypothetical protein